MPDLDAPSRRERLGSWVLDGLDQALECWETSAPLWSARRGSQNFHV